MKEDVGTSKPKKHANNNNMMNIQPVLPNACSLA